MIVKPLSAYIQTSCHLILTLSWLHRQFQRCLSLIQLGTSCMNQVVPENGRGSQVSLQVLSGSHVVPTRKVHGLHLE
jgi:hypothetical protein